MNSDSTFKDALSGYYNWFFRRAPFKDLKNEEGLLNHIIQFNEGEIISMKPLFSREANVGMQRKYRVLILLLSIIWKFLSRIGNLGNFFLVILTLIYIRNEQNYYQEGTHRFAFVIYFLFYVAKELWFYIKSSKIDRKILYALRLEADNEGQIEYERVINDHLKVGDIVFLIRDEPSPADILIIDMKDPSCCVDTREIDHKSELSLKLPMRSTSVEQTSNFKGNIRYYKQLLTGLLSFNEVDELDPRAFRGSLKLRNDPKGENLGEKNIIFMHSRIRNTDWLIGLVLRVKNERKTPYLKHNKSQFDKQIDKYMFCSIFFVLVIATLCMIAGNYDRVENGKEYINKYFSIKNDIIYQILIYSTFIPINIYFIVDIILIIQEKKWSKSINELEGFMCINNPQVLSHLGNIKIAVMEKNTIVDPEKYVIKSLYDVNNFLLDFQIPNNKSSNGSSSTLNSPESFPKQVSNINQVTKYASTENTLDTRVPNIPMAFVHQPSNLEEDSSPFVVSPVEAQNSRRALLYLTRRFSGMRSYVDSQTGETVYLGEGLNTSNNQQGQIQSLKEINEEGKIDENFVEDKPPRSPPQIELRKNQLIELMKITNSASQSSLKFPNNPSDSEKPNNNFEVSLLFKETDETKFELNSKHETFSDIHNPYLIQFEEESKQNYKSSDSIIKENENKHRGPNEGETQTTLQGTDFTGKEEQKLEKLQNEAQNNGIKSPQSEEPPAKDLEEEQADTKNQKNDQNLFINGFDPIEKRSYPYMSTISEREFEETPLYPRNIGSRFNTNETPSDGNKEISRTPTMNSIKINKEITNNEIFLKIEESPMEHSLDEKRVGEDKIVEFSDLVGDDGHKGSSKKFHSEDEIKEPIDSKKETFKKSQFTNIKKDTKRTRELLLKVARSSDDLSQISPKKKVTINILPANEPLKEIPSREELESPVNLASPSFNSQDLRIKLNSQKLRYSNDSPLLKPTEKSTALLTRPSSFGVNQANTYVDSPTSKSARRKAQTTYSARQRASNSAFSKNSFVSRVYESKNGKNTLLTPPVDFEKPHTKHLLKVMSLCHNIRSRKKSFGISTNKTIFQEKRYVDDELILNLSQSSSTYFENSAIVNNDLCFKIKNNGKSERYKILGIDDCLDELNRISVIVEAEKEEGPILYTRSSDLSIISIFDLQEVQKEKIIEKLSTLAQEGFRILIYGEKKLSDEEYKEFFRRNSKKSAAEVTNNGTNPPEFSENYPSIIEFGCSLVGLVLFVNEVRAGIARTVESFLTARIKTFLLSSDDEAKTLSAAFQVRILRPELTNVQIKGNNNESALLAIKSILAKIKTDILGKDFNDKPARRSLKELISEVDRTTLSKSYSDKNISKGFKNYAILTDQQSLDIIFKDDYLYTHFHFILAFCRSFVAYGLNIKTKEIIMEMIKGLPNSPSTLTIGYSDNDFVLSDKSDVSFLVHERGNKFVKGDIDIKYLSILSKLIFYRSKFLIYKLSQTTYFVFYVCQTFSWSVFFLNATSSFSAGLSIHSVYQTFLMNVFLIVPILIYFLNDEKDDSLMELHPSLFYKNSKKLRPFYNTFWYKVCFLALKDAVLVYFFGTFISEIEEVEDSIDINIWSSEQTLFIFLLILLQSSLFLKIERMRVLPIFVVHLILFGFHCLLCFFVNPNYNSLNLIGRSGIFELITIFKAPGRIMKLLLIIISSLLTSKVALSYRVSRGSAVAEENQEYREILKSKDLRLVIHGEGFNREKPFVLIQKKFTDAIKKIFARNIKIDPLINDILNPGKFAVKQANFNQYSLKFKDTFLERKYQLENLETSLNTHMFSTTILLVCNILILGFSNHQKGSKEFGDRNFHFVSLAIVCMLLFWIIFCRSTFFDRNFRILTKIMAFVLFLHELFSYFLIDLNFDEMELKLIGSIITILNLPSLFTYFKVLFFGVLALLLPMLIKIGLQVELLVSDNKTLTNLIYARVFYIYIISCFCIHIIMANYKLEKKKKRHFLEQVSLESQTRKNKDILAILMPKFVGEILNKGEFSLAEDQGEVAILFCDICDFEQFVALQGKDLIKILDQIFRAFDHICNQRGVQKIETVGKTYMGSAGLKACKSYINNQGIDSINPVRRVLNLALDMMEKIKSFQPEDENFELKVKIGIHYGPVFAGVIGHHKPQFSLIGDTVNTTSRVCSTGEKGTITLSEQAFNQVFEMKEFFAKRVVEAKGKGKINTYQYLKYGDHTNKCSSSAAGFQKTKSNLSSPKKLKRGTSIFLLEIQAPKPKVEDVFSFPIKVETSESIQIERPRMKNILTNRNSSEALSEDKKSQVLTNSKFRKLNTMMNIENLPVEKPKNPSLSSLKGPPVIEIIDQIEEFSELKLLCKQGNQQFMNKDVKFGRRFLMKPKKKSIKISNGSKFLSLKKKLPSGKVSDYKRFEDLAGFLLKPSRFFLKLDESQRELEQAFFENMMNQFLSKQRNFFIQLAMLYSFKSFLLIIIFLSEKYLYVFCSRLPFTIILFLMRIFQNFIFGRNWLITSYNAVTILTCLTITLEGVIVRDETFVVGNDIEVVFTLLIFSKLPFISFIKSLRTYIVVFILWFIIRVNLWSKDFAFHLIFIFLSLIILLVYVHRKHLENLEHFNDSRKMILKKSEQQNLVMHLLPEHILEQYLNNPEGKLDDIEEQEGVSMLFADIAGFTKYSSTVNASQVVSMLRELFIAFDQLCLKHNVFKLYTIGDCYVALGLTNATTRDIPLEARNLVNMAFDMITTIQTVRKRVNFHELDMRIGIHTGKIIGGIIGTDIVRYDIYGPDVLIANKMESNGQCGHVVISEDTKYLLEAKYDNEFQFEEYKDVHVDATDETISSFKVHKLDIKSVNQNNTPILNQREN